MNEKKICFVVMGFGKKMDYRNSREINLDIIYQKVVKELFFEEYPEYELIRADEICGSDLIDVSMYTLLLKADLVIADITTMNENALYELGVRHGLKPFSTVIMLQKSDVVKIPFDLNHSRILTYADFGEILDSTEAVVIKSSLKKFINESSEEKIDSPFYTFLPQVTPPIIDEENYTKILQKTRLQQDSIALHLQAAESLKLESNFSGAIIEWEYLHKLIPGNEYITQQLAFSLYKSKSPNETISLQNALDIINTLNPKRSLDLETLGITGAIYKRLYDVNNNFDYLEIAIEMYRKGYVIKNDYYNGENYANCLLLKTLKGGLNIDDINYLKYESKKTYKHVSELLQEKISSGDIDYWMYATLSTCYYCLNDLSNHQKYKDLFTHNSVADWEIESYTNNLSIIKNVLSQL